jgi:Flp pilus assembly protein CpaB
LVTTQVIMQNAKVLAVDQEVADDSDKPHNSRTITLELLPQDAAVVVQAADSGTVQMTLRNPLDKLVTGMERPGQAIPAETGHVRKVTPRMDFGYTRIVSLGGRMETYRCTQAQCVAENKMDPGVLASPQAAMIPEPVETAAPTRSPSSD